MTPPSLEQKLAELQALTANLQNPWLEMQLQHTERLLGMLKRLDNVNPTEHHAQTNRSSSTLP